MCKSFPEILVELRKNHKLTQEELSIKLSCSRMYIHLLEKGERNPSVGFLNRLSNLYSVDLSLYHSEIPIEHQKIYTTFRNAIEINTTHTNYILAELLGKYKNDDCFKYGEMKNLYMYTEALYYFREEDFKFSNSICVQLLELNNHKIEDLEKVGMFFTPIEYCTMVLMTVMAVTYKTDNCGITNLVELHKNIKRNFFGDDFYLGLNLTIIIRVYIILNNNISTMYLEEGNFDKSLSYIEEAISFNHKYYNSSLTHNLYFTKAECLYAKYDYENTIKSVFQILANCSAISDELVDTYIKKIEISFPNVLDKLNLEHIRELYL